MSNSKNIVNDVTGLNPISVWSISTPKTVQDVQKTLERDAGAISVGGGHFSMGGQTASPNSLHLDMRQMNKILLFNPSEKYIRVEAGVRWCDIQKFVDPHNLAVKIMQTYANFTVGGSLSVNVHGRYIGLGPLIMSVRSIKIILADGKVINASPLENAKIFYGAIGGYGGLGVIVEAELDLTDNIRMERISKRMKTSEYLDYFIENVRSSDTAVIHNADIYSPKYKNVNAVTWRKTKKAASHNQKLQHPNKPYWLEKAFFWVFSETFSGKWQREYIVFFCMPH